MMITKIIRVGFILLIFLFIDDFNAHGQIKISQKNFFSDPILSRSYLQKGKLQFANHQTEDAYESCLLAIRYDSENWQAWRLKAQNEIRMHLLDSAIKSVTKSIYIHEKYELDTIGYFFRAQMKSRLSQWRESANDYSSVILHADILDSNIIVSAAVATSYLNRAQCRANLYDYINAINDLEFLNKAKPLYADSYSFLAAYYLNVGMEKNAIRAASQQLSRTGDSKIPYEMRGYAYFNLAFDWNILEYADSAIADLTQRNSYGNDVNIVRTLGKLYQLKGDTLNSRKAFQKSQDISPDDPSINLDLGDVETVVHKNYKKANYFYQKFLDAGLKYHVHYGAYLALTHYYLKDTARAIDEIEGIIALDSNNSNAYKARLKMMADDPQIKLGLSTFYDSVIIHDFTALIRMSPDDKFQSEFYEERSVLYSRNPSTIKNALKDIERSISLNPDASAITWWHRASYNFVINFDSCSERKAREMVNDLDKATALDKNFIEAFSLKAIILKEFLKQTKTACACLKKISSKDKDKEFKEFKKYICDRKNNFNGSRELNPLLRGYRKLSN